MKISTRLYLLSALLLSSFILLLSVAVFSLNSILLSIKDIRDADAYMSQLTSCDELLLRQLAEGQRIMLTDTDAVNGDILISIRLKNSELNKTIRALETARVPDVITKNSAIISGFNNLYSTIDNQLIQKIFNRETINPAEVSRLIMNEYQHLKTDLDNYEKEVNNSLQKIISINNSIRIRSYIIFTAVFTVMAVFLTMTVIFFRRTVLGTVKRTSEEMLKLSEGGASLDYRFNDFSENEIGELSIRFNSFLDNMERMIVRIADAGRLSSELGRRMEDDIHNNTRIAYGFESSFNQLQNYFTGLSATVHSINSMADDIFSDSSQSRNIADEQSRILKSTAESIERTVAEISALRDKGKSGLMLTESLMSDAADGVAMIRTLDKEIDSFLDSTGELQKINDVINNISDKTKILGINAAIEASRAGSAGKGFKVVAEEIAELGDLVRQNADKTSVSLEEIIASIHSIKKRSENGKIKFESIEHSAGIVFDSVNSISEKLLEHEKHESDMIGSINGLSSNSSRIVDIIRELDGRINGIFNSVKVLEQDFSSTEESLCSASRGAEELNKMTLRLESISKEYHSVAETLDSYIEHFNS